MKRKKYIRNCKASWQLVEVFPYRTINLSAAADNVAVARDNSAATESVTAIGNKLQLTPVRGKGAAVTAFSMNTKKRSTLVSS